MKRPVVCDSTCLIALERIDYLKLLPNLFEPVVIPPSVEEEFGAALSWFEIHRPSNSALVASLEIVVDRGEAEAIALAHETQFLLVLDDRQARSAARHLGLTITGTIGVLLKAKRAGLIDAVKPLLDQLRENALRQRGACC